MAQHIFLRQALKLIDELEVFDIEIRTFNKFNKSGGSYRIYKNAKKVKSDDKKSSNVSLDFYRKARERKNPNHWENATRNIELPNGQIKKIKIRYIIKLNGIEVIY